VLGLLVVVSLSGESASDSLWHVGATLGPDLLVQVGVDSDVLGAHLLESKLSDSLDSFSGSEFSALSVDSLVEVDGVLSGDDLLHGGSLLLVLLFWSHFG